MWSAEMSSLEYILFKLSWSWPQSAHCAEPGGIWYKCGLSTYSVPFFNTVLPVTMIIAEIIFVENYFHWPGDDTCPEEETKKNLCWQLGRDHEGQDEHGKRENQSHGVGQDLLVHVGVHCYRRLVRDALCWRHAVVTNKQVKRVLAETISKVVLEVSHHTSPAILQRSSLGPLPCPVTQKYLTFQC